MAAPPVLLRTVVAVVVALSKVGGSLGSSVICPSSMSAGETHTCFVAGLSPSQLASTTVKLVGAQEITGVASAASPGLFSLSLPTDIPLGDYQAKAESSGASDQSVNVKVTAQAALVLLENDKAKYKPGQTALFRVLVVSLVQRLPLQSRQLEYSITGPTGFKLMQGTGETDSSGVFEFEYPISEEPLMGNSVAQVALLGVDGAAASSETTFAVEEYVLPRFEVALSIDQPYLTAAWGSTGNAEVSGKVTATYTYGEGVNGKAKVTALKKLMPWEMPAIGVVDGGKPEAEEEKGTPYQEVATLTDVDVSSESGGTFSFLVPKSQLQGDLLIEAMVEDPTSKEEQSATETLPVTYSGGTLNVHVTTDDGASHFKPGLPTKVRVELKLPSGAHAGTDQIEDQSIKLTCQRSYVEPRQKQDSVEVALNVASFQDGVARVDIPNPLEEAECCDPSAKPADEEEYKEAMGCCVSTVNCQVMQGEMVLWSGNDPEMVSHLCLSRAYSPSGHFLRVTPPGDSDTSVEVFSTTAWGQLEDVLDYMFLQGGAIVFAGTASPTETKEQDGYWVGRLAVPIQEGLAGRCRIVVVARTAANGIAVTGSADFERSLEFPYSLLASFSPELTLPGSEVTIEVKIPDDVGDAGNPGDAVAFLTSLDRSAELLGKRASISREAVLAGLDRAAKGSQEVTVNPRLWQLCYLFGNNVHIAGELPEGLAIAPVENPGSEPTGDNVDQPYGPSLGENCPRPISNGCSGGGFFGGLEDDMVMFEAAAMPMAGNEANRGEEEADGAVDSGTVANSQTIRVRKFFPETWIFEKVTLTGGSASLTRPAPDTITNYTLEAFAVSPTGGISAVRSDPLKVFKPVFAEVRLPYCATRTEELEVIVVVKNYAEGSGSMECTVVVTVADELKLEVGETSSTTQTVQVEEDSAVRITRRVRAGAIGNFAVGVQVEARKNPGGAVEHSDALERALCVKAEGFTVTDTYNMLLEPTAGSAATDRVTLQLPDNYVEGSERARVSVVGDLMGPTISGLESLLQIPTGCGEQNMITLAPNVYVAKYLASVNRLTPALRQRVTKNMLVGYGRQLTYRHSDGSFSAFGEQDGDGSTWLTAFVLKTFAEVQESGLVSTDPRVLEEAAAFLIAKQVGDGSFVEEGRVIHQEMMGGVSGDGRRRLSGDGKTALTSFVLASLAEVRTALPSLSVSGLQEAVEKAGDFLMNADAGGVYSRMMRNVALSAAGLITYSSAASNILEVAETTPDHCYWTATAQVSGYGAPNTLDVELTGYGLKVLTMAENMEKAFASMRYLVAKRQASGGFSSTQDTVLALCGLSVYATKVAGAADLQVKLTGSGLDETLTVDSSNFDVMQIRTATPGPDQAMDVEATGTGQALVVASVTYNLLEKPTPPCYNVEVDWFNGEGPAAILGGVARGCAAPREDCVGKAGAGMWIMSIGLFTGYSAPSAGLKDLKKKGFISRYEIEDGRVELYFNHIPANSVPACVEFNVTKDYDVQNLQAQPSAFYEYYAPEKAGAALTSFQMKPYAPMPGASPVTNSGRIPSCSPWSVLAGFVLLAVWC